MKTSDVDILIVPDLGGAGDDHWQSRWARNLKTAHVVGQSSWHAPAAPDWADTIFAAAQPRTRPTVIVAHGLGVLAVAHAAERLAATTVVGAFLVAPIDLALATPGAGSAGASANGAGTAARRPALPGFWPLPAEQLPWPALVIGSANDPMCLPGRAAQLARDWGADFTDAGTVGHVDIASGHGPWPEGLLRFGQFLRGLD